MASPPWALVALGALLGCATTTDPAPDDAVDASGPGADAPPAGDSLTAMDSTPPEVPLDTSVGREDPPEPPVEASVMDNPVDTMGAPEAGPDAEAGPLLCGAAPGGGCYRETAAGQRCPSGHVAVTPPQVGYRLTRLRFERPATLTTSVVEGFFDGALAAGTALFGFGTMDAATVRVGPLNTRCVAYGARGRGLLDGAFRFHAGDAPGPGGASRWDPARVGVLSAGPLFTLGPATTVVRWPLFTESGDPQVELPLTSLQLREVRPSADLGCVGVAAYPGGVFDECSPSAWLTRDPVTGAPYGLLEALIMVEDTRAARLMTVPGMPTLCSFLAGADCEATAMTSWPTPPDATLGGRPAWRLVANFSAVAARILP